MMLVLWHHERDENIDVEQADHSSALAAVGESVDVLDRECWCRRPAGKHGNAAFDTHVRLSETTQQGLDERMQSGATIGSRRSHARLVSA